MKKIITLLLLIFIAGCATKKVNQPLQKTQPLQKPQIVYKDKCQSELVEKELSMVIKSTERFCTGKGVIKITFHKCQMVDEVISIQVSYLCKE